MNKQNHLAPQMILSAENIKVGLRIRCISNPEWGTFSVQQDRNGWIYSSPRSTAMLFRCELHFWEIV